MDMLTTRRAMFGGIPAAALATTQIMMLPVFSAMEVAFEEYDRLCEITIQCFQAERDASDHYVVSEAIRRRKAAVLAEEKQRDLIYEMPINNLRDLAFRAKVADADCCDSQALEIFEHLYRIAGLAT